MSEAYHTKWRPKNFKTVKGQDEACRKLEGVLDKGTSRTFLLFGPSGCGKTTLARIGAVHAGCNLSDILERDASTYSGADETRQLQEIMAFRPIGGGENRAVILDECHGLSQKAWDTLLKTVEEPNSHSLWFFCTTNPLKVPKTIQTRCLSIELKLMDEQSIARIVRRVIKQEKLDIPEAVVDVIVREARGSGRQALVNLAAVEDCTTGKEAARALHTLLEDDATIELCRFLLKGGSWMKAMGIVTRLGEKPNYEGVRIVVCNYMGKVLQGAKSDEAAAAALDIIEAFAVPYNSAEGNGPFMLSLGRVLLG